MKKALLLLLGYCPLVAMAQQSFMQDKAGETSLLFPGAGVTFNAADANIAISASRADTAIFYGATIKAKADEGLLPWYKALKYSPS